MKRIILIINVLGLLTFETKSQNTNPCGLSWSGWNTAWNYSYGKVYYRLQFAGKSCTCGWKFVQIQHNLPHKARINLELEGYDCDEKYMKSSFDSETTGGEISKDQGDWHTFKRVTGVVKVVIEFEEGKNRIRYESGKSGTTKYINGMTEKEYNQRQQKADESKNNSSQGNTSKGPSESSDSRSSSSGTTSGNRPGSGVNNPGGSDNGGSKGNNGNYGTSNANGSNPQKEQERIRIEREEQIRKQQEAAQKQRAEEERKRQEAIRREQERYEEQLRQITRKSEARAQSHATISQGVGAIFSGIQETKAKKRLAEDETDRERRLADFKEKLSSGEYELVDCETCRGDGYLNCANCKNKGKSKCIGCSGKGGKTCESCNGSGKKKWGDYTLSCTQCIGTGSRQCMACNNVGETICAICHGRGERQCYCDGTGKKLKRKDNQKTEATGTNEPISKDDLLLQNARIDSSILSGNPIANKPKSDGPDSIYYLSYKRLYTESLLSPVSIKLYKMYKYSDGTYPLLSSVYQKINIVPGTTNAGTIWFIGYYDTRATAINALKEMTDAATKQGIKVIYEDKIQIVNPRQSNTTTNDDFWNN